MKTFDSIVWGMIWGKERGDLGTRGLVNRQRMALPLELGGLKVLIPSVMIKAIRTDMVNRALKEKGRWWTPFFYHWCRKAERGLFRGADGLLHKISYKEARPTPRLNLLVDSVNRLVQVGIRPPHPPLLPP